MKRMHIHVAVTDLEHSIGFYSNLFAAQPDVVEEDYAKWMLEDPRVNFAISARGVASGIDHLGIQVDSAGELGEIHDRLDAAGEAMQTQQATTCCYARSDKHWVTDPQGVAWETFHTLGTSPTFGTSRDVSKPEEACCTPEVTPAVAKSCCSGAAS